MVRFQKPPLKSFREPCCVCKSVITDNHGDGDQVFVDGQMLSDFDRPLPPIPVGAA